MSIGDWDSHEAPIGSRTRAATRYTNCKYCGERFALRDISFHARTAHPVESLRYTNCWYCKERFPLNQIRSHATTCAARSA